MTVDFVSVRDLVFEYGAQRALDGVSFQLPAGAVVALVGPNGAGKTTLLRCLAGLERPLSGQVALDGIDVLEQPRLAHRKLGFQQDFFGVYDDLSVRRNLLHAAAIQGMAEDDFEPAAIWAAEAVDLSDRLDSKAGTLSRGMRQRLAIARAIVHRPRLLLLDEPASGLDPEARRSLSGLIRTLRAAGMTMVVSSHILAELEDYSTHMLALRSGRAAEIAVLAGSDAPKSRWRLQLLGDARDAAAVLASFADATDVDVIDGDVEFTFTGEPMDRHILLRHIMDNGIAVTAFSPTGGHLEKLYMGGGARI